MLLQTIAGMGFCFPFNLIIFFFLFQVYKGYVDDPRNTDNAWMETVAVNFHDELGIFIFFFYIFAFSLQPLL